MSPRAQRDIVHPRLQSSGCTRPLNFTVRWHLADLTPFERRVLNAFVAGAEPQLQILRAQAVVATVSSREHTGVGAYIHLEIPQSVPAVSPPKIILDDVHVEVADVPDGVTSLLWIKSGRIAFLEFATYTGSWPQDPQITDLGYYRFVPWAPKAYSLVPVERRDSSTLARALAGTGASADAT